MSDPDVLALAFDHSPVGMCVTARGRVVACNRELGWLLGWHPDELVGRSLAECGLAQPSAGDAADAGDGTPASLQAQERVLLRRDGGPFWCRVAARPVDRSPLSTRLVWTFQDLSATRRVLPGLTVRELQVAQALVAGGTSKDIAQQVGISPRTVEGYRGRLMRKMDAANQRQLVALLAGLMQPAPPAPVGMAAAWG